MNRELIREAKEFIEKTQMSASAFANSIGYSPAALSQWLNFAYKGKVDKLESMVRSRIDSYSEKAELKAEKKDFLNTSVSGKIFEIADYCRLENEIGVIYGDAGLGKTYTVKKYVEANPSCILIEADLGYTSKVLFVELCRMLKLDSHGPIHNLFEDVVARLSGTDRMIVIDEAEHLPYKALELIRRVHDKAGIGILLVGMPQLIGNLRGKRGEFAQLYSRIGAKGALCPLLKEDTRMFVKNALPSSNGIYSTFHEVSKGNTRVLTKLIKRAVRMAEINSMEITEGLVIEAGKTLLI